MVLRTYKKMSSLDDNFKSRNLSIAKAVFHFACLDTIQVTYTEFLSSGTLGHSELGVLVARPVASALKADG